MNEQLELILKKRKTEELLFNNRYRLKYIYSFLGYLKLAFGATAIPKKVHVYDKVKHMKIGTILKDERLFALAF